MKSTASLRQQLQHGPYCELAPWDDQIDTLNAANRTGVNISKPFLPTERPFENRVFTCIVTSPVGRPLQFFETRLELPLALRDAVKAHRYLFQDAKILHQDISAWNILISDPQHEGDPHGILVDLDVAVDLTEGSPKPEGAIGTRPFMSIGVLRWRNHTYRHDLESFLYLLLWVIIEKQKNYAPEGSRFREWNQGPWTDSATLKTSDMAQDSFRKVLAEFGPDSESLKPLAERLRVLLFPIKDGELWTGTTGSKAAINALYDGFIDAFQETIQQEQMSMA